MYNRKEVKLLAKSAIQGKLGTCFVVCFCVTVMYYAVNSLATAFGNFDMLMANMTGMSITMSLGKAALINWTFLAAVALPLMVSIEGFFLGCFAVMT